MPCLCWYCQLFSLCQRQPAPALLLLPCLLLIFAAAASISYFRHFSGYFAFWFSPRRFGFSLPLPPTLLSPLRHIISTLFTFSRFRRLSRRFSCFSLAAARLFQLQLSVFSCRFVYWLLVFACSVFDFRYFPPFRFFDFSHYITGLICSHFHFLPGYYFSLIPNTPPLHRMPFSRWLPPFSLMPAPDIFATLAFSSFSARQPCWLAARQVAIVFSAFIFFCCRFDFSFHAISSAFHTPLRHMPLLFHYFTIIFNFSFFSCATADFWPARLLQFHCWPFSLSLSPD